MRRCCTLLALAGLGLGPACTRGQDLPPVPRIDVHVRVHPHAYDAVMRLLPEVALARVVNLDGGPPGEVLATLVELGELSRGQVLTLTGVDWRDVDAADFGSRAARQLERAVALGARGLAVDRALGMGVTTRDGRLLAVDDPRLDPLWAKAAELRVPVFLQTGDPGVLAHAARTDARAPRREDLLAQRDLVLARHPRTLFVCQGMASAADDVTAVDALLGAFPNAMVDTALALGGLAGQPPERVRAFFRKNRQRILFGSGLGVDAQGWTLGAPTQRALELSAAREFYDRHFRILESLDPEIANPVAAHGPAVLHGLGLEREVLDAIYLRNAERVLGLGVDPASERGGAG